MMKSIPANPPQHTHRISTPRRFFFFLIFFTCNFNVLFSCFLFPISSSCSNIPPTLFFQLLNFIFLFSFYCRFRWWKQNKTQQPLPFRAETRPPGKRISNNTCFIPKKLSWLFFWGIFFLIQRNIPSSSVWWFNTLLPLKKNKIFKFQIPLINKITTKKSVVVEWKSFTLFSVPLVS